MKKKYIQPTVDVVVMHAGNALLNYSVTDYSDGGTSILGDNEESRSLLFDGDFDEIQQLLGK